MSFQHDAFQHDAFQVQVVGAAEGAPLRSLMGVGLGVRLLAASQLKEPLTKRKLAQTILALVLPWRK